MRPVMRPAIARALLAGLAGTTAMTLTTALERRLRPGLDHPVDYDASRHVAVAVGTVLRRPARTEAERQAYFALAHWGYGSAVAVGYAALRTRLPARQAAPAFLVGCQAMAWTLFPTIGGAPAPSRWRRDVVVSSVGQHAVYVATVATVGAALERSAMLGP